MSVVTVDEAVALIVAAAPRLETRHIGLARAHGRVLAADVVALRDHPPFAAAAMDGYAVASGARTLQVIGESRAGAAFAGAIAADQAVRVFTGAPVPCGTIAVIMQEKVSRDGDTITVTATDAKPHLRAAGEDFAVGEAVLMAGERLDAHRLALAAAAGAGAVEVRKRPRIAFVGTGDELVTPGEAPRRDQVYESASLALVALAHGWGAEAKWLGIGADEAPALAQTVASLDADLIVTVGGASVGDYDVVRPALASLGWQADFDAVDMKPGRPSAFGRLGDGRLVLCLPGNPGTALICAHLFLRAFVAAALGETIDHAPQTWPCATALPANGGRETFLRARRTSDGALPFADQDSALLRTFARTDLLIRRRAQAPASEAGAPLEIIDLRAY